VRGKRREHHHQISGCKMRIEQGASPPNIRSGSITTKHQVRRAGRRGHHHQISGQKMRIEKGASPPNFR
tara:strand:- start:361 stop:567 length:207 start_codon:yes stop_codon:yes gene_type:complete